MFAARQPEQVESAAATISACVESRPPETPMTTRLIPRRLSRFAGPGPGCCRPRAILAQLARDRPARRGSDRSRARAAAASRPAHRAEAECGGTRRMRAASSRAQSRNVLTRMRSWRMRPRSTSAVIIVELLRQSVRSRRACRRIRRSPHGRPRRDRWSIRRGRRRNRHRPQWRGPIAWRTAVAASRPCRW